MPRVSAAHLAARREQILDAAARCFVRNGFHHTSMQDVIKEAGLSVGAFYRYFSSKAELIRAIAEEKVGTIVGTLEQLLEQEPPPAMPVVMAELLAQVDRNLGEDGPVRIAVQVWGEAAYDPAFADLVGAIYGRIRDKAAVLAAKVDPAADPAALAAVMVGLVQGYIIQRVLAGRVDREVYLKGLGALMSRYGAEGAHEAR
ncbi:TetR/AcrR family transcriptional regulator [Dactylosporangium matsuzakiense]|nr:TetR/AcrR family transcriptional regulator [Dactylosporangium matsuzakiense]UWZ43125.1 TetR/AcrR family transcriptional regulator [Dactylosporangium matsuzakiense]